MNKKESKLLERQAENLLRLSNTYNSLEDHYFAELIYNEYLRVKRKIDKTNENNPQKIFIKNPSELGKETKKEIIMKIKIKNPDSFLLITDSIERIQREIDSKEVIFLFKLCLKALELANDKDIPLEQLDIKLDLFVTDTYIVKFEEKGFLLYIDDYISINEKGECESNVIWQ